MNIYELTQEYIKLGYQEDDIASKVAQDIILLKIGKSKYAKNITIKGRVVMHNISKDLRRATRDMDLDFIKYSLEDKSIFNFIKELNNVDDDIEISIEGSPTKLHHQDYDGKRIYVILKDKYGESIRTKLDIGVHKYFDIVQDEYLFDFNILGDSVSLLINSNEQIIVEKLKSLLKFGITSTRFKDIFDFYYLMNNQEVDRKKLLNYIELLIYRDETINQNNYDDLMKRLTSILSSKQYKSRLNSANSNWLEIPIDKVIKNVLNYFNSLKDIEVHN